MPLGMGAGAAGGNGGGGVILTNSADLEESSNQYFSRTPASQGTSIRIGTVSVWLKREEVTNDLAFLFAAREDADTNDRSVWRIDSDDKFKAQFVESTQFRENLTQIGYAQTDYHHWVFVWDTPNATAANRLRIYRDGTELTLDTSGNGNPAQNENTWFSTTNLHLIGRNHASSAQQYDGLMADFNYIDGLALTPADFVTWDGSNFTIKNYAGSYGTNGCRLRFDNASDLGEDSSGNGNDWTNNNSVSQSTTVPTSPVS